MKYRNILRAKRNANFGVLVGLFFLPFTVLAQGTSGAAPLSNLGDFLTTIDAYMRSIMPFLISVAVFFVFWGLSKFVLNASDESARTDAKNIVLWGVTAVFVMLSFWGLVALIQNTVDLDTTPPNVIGGPVIAPDVFNPVIK